MKLYEYQAKEILRKYNIDVPNGEIASNTKTAVQAYSRLGANRCIIKAQVHAGGRGKGGGIKIGKTLAEVKRYTSDIIGSFLTTAQTGKKGIKVNNVLIEEAVDIEKELYLAISIDRSISKPVIISSTEGGMEIEEVSSKTPHKIFKEQINPVFIHDFQARQIAHKLNLTGPLLSKASNLVSNLFKAFIENDCSLLEINPLVLTSNKKIFALDVKMDIDDNALFRHKELLKMRDLSEVDIAEKKSCRIRVKLHWA